MPAPAVWTKLPAPAVNRTTLLDLRKPYLYQRYAEGRHNALQLYREIRARGYTGSAATVGRYIRQLRKGTTAPPSQTRPQTTPDHRLDHDRPRPARCP
ncbi:hypothetical protein AB0H12_43690 [Actinosynnema sp. NPDC023794]